MYFAVGIKIEVIKKARNIVLSLMLLCEKLWFLYYKWLLANSEILKVWVKRI